MVTIAQAKSQLQQQRQLVQQRQQEASRAKVTLEQQRRDLPDVTSQKALRSQDLTGRARRRQVMKAKEQTTSNIGKVTKTQKELKRFEKEELPKFEKKIKQAEIEQIKADQFNRAVKVFTGQQTAGEGFENIPEDIRARAQEKAEELERGAQRSALREFKIETEELSPETKVVIDLPKAKVAGFESTGLQMSFESIADFNAEVKSRVPQMSIFTGNIPATKVDVPLQMSVLPPERKSDILSTIGRIATKVTDLPIIKRTPLGGLRPSLKPDKFKTITLAKEAQKVRTAVDELGLFTKQRFENIARTTGIGTGDIEVNRKLAFVGFTEKSPSIGKLVSSIAGVAPELLIFPVSAGADIILGARKLDPISVETETSKRLDLLTLEAKQQPIQEGFRAPTRTEVEIQVGEEVRKGIRTEGLFQAGIAAGTLLTLGGLKVGKNLLRTEIISTKGALTGLPKPQVISKTVRFGELPIATDKGVTTLQTIEGEVFIEPAITQTTSKARRLLSLPPKVKITPAKLVRFGTPLPIVDSKPFLLELAKARKGGAPGASQFSTVKSIDSGAISAEEVSKLGGIPEFLLERLAVKQTGAPVPRKLLSKFFKEDTIFGLSRKQTLRLSGVPGKQTTLEQTLVKITDKQTLPSGVEVSKFTVISKDISKPFARRIGATPSIEGTAFRFPIVDRTTKGTVGTTFGGTRGGTSLEKTFATPKIEESIAKVIPKVDIKIPKPKTTITSQTGVTQELPSMVGGVGLKEIPFSGTGLFERTENFVARDMRGIQPVGIIDRTLLDSKVDIKLLSDEKQIQAQRTKVITQPSISSISIVGLASESKIGQVPVSTSITAQVPKQTSLTKVGLANILTQVQAQKVTSRTDAPKLKQPKRPQPKPKIPKIIPPVFIRSAKERLKEEAEDLIGSFRVFVKKKGKDVKIGEFKTKSKARTKLKKELLASLRAGGFVEEGGKKVRIDLGREFRPSKIDPLVVIEKKAKRLRKGTTGKEIQFFRTNIKKRRIF